MSGTQKSPKINSTKRERGTNKSTGRRTSNRFIKEEQTSGANEEMVKEAAETDNKLVKIHQKITGPEGGQNSEDDGEVVKKEENDNGSNTTTDEPGTPVAKTNGSLANVAHGSGSQQVVQSPEVIFYFTILKIVKNFICLVRKIQRINEAIDRATN